MLSPFLYKEKLIDIFGEDLYENKELLNTFLELLGYGKTKPFECVGTNEEVRHAVGLTIQKLIKSQEPELPYLLKYYKDNYSLETSQDIEKRYNNINNIETEFEKILKEGLEKSV